MKDTSLATYENEIRPHLGQKQAALRRLLMAYPEGLTNAEMAQLLGWTINRVTPRCLELREMGVALDAGTRKCKVTGRTAHAWKLKHYPLKVAEKTNRLELSWSTPNN